MCVSSHANTAGPLERERLLLKTTDAGKTWESGYSRPGPGYEHRSDHVSRDRVCYSENRDHRGERTAVAPVTGGYRDGSYEVGRHAYLWSAWKPRTPQTWSVSKVSMFGPISRIRVGKNGRAVALVEFDDYFEFPSELYLLDSGHPANNRALRRKDWGFMDILFLDKAYAAGFEPSGGIFRTPIPGKVGIVPSSNLTIRRESTGGDYRAVGRDG